MGKTNKKALPVTINWGLKHNISIILFFLYFLFINGVYATGHTWQQMKTDWVIPIFLTGILICFLSMVEMKAVQNVLKKYRRWVNAAFLILLPFICFLMVEEMVSNFNIEMFRKYGQYNLVWYAVICFFVYALSRNTRIAMQISVIVIYLLSMVNYLVYTFRGNPILPSDLLAWKTGVSVASSYQLSFTKEFLVSTLIMMLVFVIAGKLKSPENKLPVLNWLAGIAVDILLMVPVFLIFFHTDLISRKIYVLDFFAPKYTYCSYGTAFSFVANVEALQTKEPDGYSAKKVRSTLQGEKEMKKKTDVKPNIIVIMNEAFSDLSLIGDFKTNMDYLPYIRSLKKNTIKGTMYSSVFGGATSDTEYEFLTGNSMAVMPSNCVPYQQFVTKPTDSLVSTLKAQGYYSIAIHPFEKSGYKRDIVYPLFGFDEFLSKDDFKNPQLIRSYISDREDYKKIIEEYKRKEKDGPLFVFNVTMQNHGGYSDDKLFGDKDNVVLTNLPGHADAEQYLSLERKTDQAFKVLIDYFSKQKKPTIILLYGDHQPIAFSSIHDELENRADTAFSESIRKKYMVPFILWANYDIKETTVDKMSANYLSSYLLKTAGLKGTEYNSYLLDLYKKLPVINGVFYIDNNDQLHQYTEPSAYSKLIAEYKMVGYNNVFDQKNHMEQYFSLDK